MQSLPRRSGRRIFAKDTDIYWEEEGPPAAPSTRPRSTRPLVLLHGLTDSGKTWNRVAATLGRTRRVLIPDLPGHGLSGRPEASYSIAWYAEVMAAWVNALGLDDFDLVGHSLGGGIAQRMLLERTGSVRRLGLVASGGLGRHVAWPIRLASIPHLVERIGQPFMREGTRLGMHLVGGAFDRRERDYLCSANARPGTARALARTVRSAIGLSGQNIHFLHHAHELPELPPTSIFWGVGDPIIAATHAMDVRKFLGGVTVTRFPDCGHYPHREVPGPFVRALERFLDEEQQRPYLRPGYHRFAPRPASASATLAR